MQKKKIKRKHQLARPKPEELDKVKEELKEELDAIDQTEDTEEEKHASGFSPAIAEKLFPVSLLSLIR